MIYSGYPVLRRAIDFAGALVGLVFAIPVIAAFALGIRWESRGPVFFVQRRPGFRGRSFGVLKLRTLYTDAQDRLSEHLLKFPDQKSEWTREAFLRCDPRIPGRIARFVRCHGIDELPQLWNVLRGQMSLVGPRPVELSLLKATFSTKELRQRQGVLPGLTGLWQVRRSAPSIATLRRYDNLYLRCRCLRVDVWICFLTFRAIVRGNDPQK